MPHDTEAPRDDENGASHTPEATESPFLMRFQVGFLGAPVAIVAQAALFNSLNAWELDSEFLRGALRALLPVYFCVGVALLVTGVGTYIGKVLRHASAARAEWMHRTRCNLFFLPFIASGTLLTAVPEEFRSVVAMKVFYWMSLTCYALVALPLFQNWTRKPGRSLRHADPTYQIPVVECFVFTIAGVQLGYKDVPYATFAVGCVLQTTVFVTIFQATTEKGGGACASCPSAAPDPDDSKPRLLWFMPWPLQRLSGEKACFPARSRLIPPALNPTMFLFLAPPSVASLAMAQLQGTFDNGFSLGAFFFAVAWLLMQLSSLHMFFLPTLTSAWFAFCFPTSALATASVAYARARPDDAFPDVLCGILCGMAILVNHVVFACTLYRLARQTLFAHDTLVSEPVVSASA
eukprot:TRINITY_DN16318_c0_g1_i1.p1 TRINITY_DN16318_c0_g1~~TRINITY_DN16318_c0_g1_i1.p1  ORF type:complete len:406 (+),score=77.92 TRINITY_DN16318_c0_g1_i1:83-1300(+)